MPVFHTGHGDVSVSNWSYQLQGANGAPLDPAALAALEFDLIVTDFSRDGTLAQAFTPAEVAALRTDAVAVSYISIGEASDFRSFWNAGWTSNGQASGTLTLQAPSWLGPTNPAWPESRKVRYWEPGWQDVVFNAAKTGWLDKIVAQGFDAAYLDIVDAYYFWAVEATAAQRRAGDPLSEMDAAQRMIDFITAMTAHARQTNPDFFVILQNGAYLIDALAGTDPARKAALLNAVGAIAVEDIYLRNGTAGENNALLPDEAAISVLTRDFLASGKAVFAVDYVNQIDKMGAFLEAALADRFIPTVATTRSLDRTLAPLRAATEGNDLIAGSAGADRIEAKGGSDHVFTFAGADTVLGGAGADVLSAGAGNDQLWGDAGDDVLLGGAGHDRLSGGTGRDVLAGGAGNDVYIVERGGDVVREAVRGGIDTVYASVSYVLPVNVERLVLTGLLDLAATGRGGADTLIGNAGENTLAGGAGRDVLKGAGAADTFLYRTATDSSVGARDVILDFAPGLDRIDLSSIDANGARAGLAAFVFIGTRGFTGAAGQLHYRQENAPGTAGDRTIVEADINGDGFADFTLALAGLHTLRAGDFVL